MRRVDIIHRLKVDGEVWRQLECGHQQREPWGHAPGKALAANCLECSDPRPRYGAVKKLADKVRR